MSKIPKKKSVRTSWHPTSSQNHFTIIFFYGMCKKEKIGAKTRFFMRHFFGLLHREHEISIFMKLFLCEYFHETLFVHIQWGYVRAIFLILTFRYVLVKGVYAPGSQSEFMYLILEIYKMICFEIVASQFMVLFELRWQN
jgi:hypothetical protein